MAGNVVCRLPPTQPHQPRGDGCRRPGRPRDGAARRDDVGVSEAGSQRLRAAEPGGDEAVGAEGDKVYGEAVVPELDAQENPGLGWERRGGAL